VSATGASEQHDGEKFASPRRIISALSLLSSTTFLAVVLSIGTNKMIAVFAGREGMGLMGLYRSLGALVTGSLSFGMIHLLAQRVSTARPGKETEGVLGAATLLLAVQAAEPLHVPLAFTSVARRMGRSLE